MDTEIKSSDNISLREANTFDNYQGNGSNQTANCLSNFQGRRKDSFENVPKIKSFMRENMTILENSNIVEASNLRGRKSDSHLHDIQNFTLANVIRSHSTSFDYKIPHEAVDYCLAKQIINEALISYEPPLTDELLNEIFYDETECPVEIQYLPNFDILGGNMDIVTSSLNDMDVESTSFTKALDGPIQFKKNLRLAMDIIKETCSADSGIDSIAAEKHKNEKLSRTESLNLSDFDINSSDELEDDENFDTLYKNVISVNQNKTNENGDLASNSPNINSQTNSDLPKRKILPDFEFSFDFDDDNTIETTSTIDELDEKFTNNNWQIVCIAEQEYEIDVRVIEPYKKVISHGGYYEEGFKAIIVFCTCYLPDKKLKDYDYIMDNLFLYVISTLELLVMDDYVIVFFHGASPKNKLPSLIWLKKCCDMIDKKLKKNLKRLLIVHPTMWLKTLFIMAKPFYSSNFRNKVKYIRNLKNLKENISTDYIFVPKEILEFDVKLKGNC
ncbi:DgyrCDS11249 [Dimorphilus gyrociliatus]|uniref:DgyrCDS11249 n=1 Tax=Dimorphilus gyrociliatus TaxID=2664684 RepID=A0A7I8W3S5_9ANNE|nr:DgyrCDS11249 [Dimorphilus gyrociliatus]